MFALGSGYTLSYKKLLLFESPWLFVLSYLAPLCLIFRKIKDGINNVPFSINCFSLLKAFSFDILPFSW